MAMMLVVEVYWSPCPSLQSFHPQTSISKTFSPRISPVQSFISIFKTNPFHMKHQQEKNTTFYPPRPQKRPPHLWELSIVPTGVPLRRVLLGRLRMHRCHPFHPLHASGVAKAAVPAKGPPVKRVSWLEKLWEFLLKAGWMNVDKNNIEIGRFCWGMQYPLGPIVLESWVWRETEK